MSAEENKATLLRVVNELNKGNFDFIDDVFSPNFAFYSPTSPNWPRGLEGARKMITQLRSILPDVHATVEDIFADGDKIAVRWTFRGTYQGEARPGSPKPGERCVAVAISTYRFVAGKIADDWGGYRILADGERVGVEAKHLRYYRLTCVYSFKELEISGILSNT